MAWRGLGRSSFVNKTHLETAMCCVRERLGLSRIITSFRVDHFCRSMKGCECRHHLDLEILLSVRSCAGLNCTSQCCAKSLATGTCPSEIFLGLLRNRLTCQGWMSTSVAPRLAADVGFRLLLFRVNIIHRCHCECKH